MAFVFFIRQVMLQVKRTTEGLVTESPLEKWVTDVHFHPLFHLSPKLSDVLRSAKPMLKTGQSRCCTLRQLQFPSPLLPQENEKKEIYTFLTTDGRINTRWKLLRRKRKNQVRRSVHTYVSVKARVGSQAFEG